MMTSLPAIVQATRARVPAIVLLAFVLGWSAGAARAEDASASAQLNKLIGGIKPPGA
jgi:hypothetical protein